MYLPMPNSQAPGAAYNGSGNSGGNAGLNEESVAGTLNQVRDLLAQVYVIFLSKEGRTSRLLT